RYCSVPSVRGTQKPQPSSPEWLNLYAIFWKPQDPLFLLLCTILAETGIFPFFFYSLIQSDSYYLSLQPPLLTQAKYHFISLSLISIINWYQESIRNILVLSF